ncbi:MAG: hypothetical protein AAGD38_07575 [Acidobacteriota bacterium]
MSVRSVANGSPWLRLVAMLAILALIPISASAELSRDDLKEAEKMFDGDVYMRVDAPCATGRHPYGTYKRPLVEVSPDGEISTEGDLAINASWWHADSTYWGVRINDPMELDELDYEDDEATVEVELEGIRAADGNDTVVAFVNIHTLEDFKAAFEKTFSRIPLQDEHDDWSADAKRAIAERRIENGMTKRQVYYITGRPESFETKSEGGKEIEIWYPRQDKGTKLGYFTAKSGETTGFPKSLRFEDGVYVGAESGSGGSFSID